MNKEELEKELEREIERVVNLLTKYSNEIVVLDHSCSTSGAVYKYVWKDKDITLTRVFGKTKISVNDIEIIEPYSIKLAKMLIDRFEINLINKRITALKEIN